MARLAGRTLSRLVPVAICVATACLLTARAAYAHGAAFGAPPPNPQGKGAPGGGAGGEPPGHVDPGFGGPIVTPGSGGAVTPRRASKRKTPITPTFETSWRLWWELNRAGLLPPRRLVASPPKRADAGTATSRPPSPEAERARLAAERVVPYLLKVLDPASRRPPDVKASALIALGKLARDAPVIEVFFRHLEDRQAPDIVRESAALGLGLLRRTSPDLRFKAHHLDSVRARLLQIFDQYVGGKKTHVPTRTRAFAAFAVGLLGDQPFQTDPLSKDGRIITKLLWERMSVPYKERDLHIALLAALGMQPRAGVPSGIRDGLRAIISRQKALGHKWDAFKKAHAVTAFGRLGGPSGNALLLRLANDRRRTVVLRLASSIGLADRAFHLAAPERSAAVRVLRKTFVLEQELLGVGLANIALGRMVGADLRAGSTSVLDFDKADALLIERAENAPWYLRGFALIGLALAAREGDATASHVQAFRSRARGILVRALRVGKDQEVRGAAAVSLGLLGDPGAVPALRAVAARESVSIDTRGHAALALGQIGDARLDVVQTLTEIATNGRHGVFRSRAALGLSLLGGHAAAQPLIEQLEGATMSRRLAGLARALGRLGDFTAVGPLMDVVDRTGASELVQAMALVSLGRLLDPEERPSLLRLTGGVCYPARAKAYQEVFTIL